VLVGNCASGGVNLGIAFGSEKPDEIRASVDGETRRAPGNLKWALTMCIAL
jgi:hypothetical protein